MFIKVEKYAVLWVNFSDFSKIKKYAFLRANFGFG
jgi:hypothetical protein